MSNSSLFFLPFFFKVPFLYSIKLMQDFLWNLLLKRSSPCTCLQRLPTDVTTMSDRDWADFYRLQARQAQLEMQEVYVLFTSKVGEFIGLCFKILYNTVKRTNIAKTLSFSCSVYISFSFLSQFVQGATLQNEQTVTRN